MSDPGWRGLSQVQDIIPETGQQVCQQSFSWGECSRPKRREQVLSWSSHSSQNLPEIQTFRIPFKGKATFPLKINVTLSSPGSVTLNLHSVRIHPFHTYLLHTRHAPGPDLCAWNTEPQSLTRKPEEKGRNLSSGPEKMRVMGGQSEGPTAHSQRQPWRQEKCLQWLNKPVTKAGARFIVLFREQQRSLSPLSPLAAVSDGAWSWITPCPAGPLERKWVCHLKKACPRGQGCRAEEQKRGRFRIEGTHVYLWPTHSDIWQKPSQYCNYPPIK